MGNDPNAWQQALEESPLLTTPDHDNPLHPERVEARLAALFRLMQRGLVYPAEYARFVTVWFDGANYPSRELVARIVEAIRTKSGSEWKDANTSAVVGVRTGLYRDWCETDGEPVPEALRCRYPSRGDDPEDEWTSSIFAQSEDVFQDSSGDLWFHIKSDRQDHLSQVHEYIEEALAELEPRFEYQDCERRTRQGDREGRVLGCRFAENLNNPADPITVAEHTLVGAEDVEHAGSSVVLAQRFKINWNHLHKMTEEQIEDLVGRTTKDTLLPGEDTRSHIKASRQQDDDGNSMFVMRLGLPFGNAQGRQCPADLGRGHNRGDEEGIYFAGFAKHIARLERIMEAQIGSSPGCMHDRLLNSVRSDLGGFFYIPSRTDLGLAPEQWSGEAARDWARFPGVDWSRLSRHFTAKSPNERMYYNHKNYLYEMATLPTPKRHLPSPSVRILTLLSDMFSRWQDAWYTPKGQPEMGRLEDHVRREWGEAEAERVMSLSVMERKGWATRMTCRLYADPDYGFRGRREENGRVRSGADTYRIHPWEIIVGALPDLSLGQGRHVIEYLREDEKFQAFAGGVSEASGVGHVLPDHRKLVKQGLGALRREAEEAVKNAATDDAQAFYRACALSLQGVQEHLQRYAELARDMAGHMNGGQHAERTNLQNIAARCEKLEDQRPETFTEAAQLIFTLHSCLHQNGEPVSVGRLDQYLDPFLEEDLRAGRIDEQEAQEVIDAFWIKMSEKVLQNRIFMQDHQPYGNLAMGGASVAYPQGASLGQWIMQVTVGGVAPDSQEHPKPVDNEVTRLCIRASARLPLNAPCLSLRVHEDTPDELLEESAQALLSGGAHPILLNDNKIVPGLLASGDGIGEGAEGGESAHTPVRELANGSWDSQVKLEDARDYACDGCYEPMLTGKNWFSLGGFTTLNPLECALNQGRLYGAAGSTYLRGKVISFRSPPPSEIESFEDLWELYFQHFRRLWEKAFDQQLATFDALGAVCPAPLLSVFTADCTEKALDIYQGGARYNVYAPCWVALSSTINSLYNIKKMVFDEREAVTSLAELVECLICDWGEKMVEPFVSSLLGPNRIAAKAERFKRLRDSALSYPKYGRGNDEVDRLGDELVQRIAQETVDVLRNPTAPTAKKMLEYAKRYGSRERPFGGFQIQPGTGTFENFVAFGKGSGASADGRRLGGPIASDMSPSPSVSDRPPAPQHASFAASLAGFTGDGASAMWDGAPTDFNIDEKFPIDELTDLLRRFAKGGPSRNGEGSNVLTVSTASPATLEAARSHPEKYDLVRLRMGGWTEFFVAMFPESQEQHRRRPISTPETKP